MNSLFLESDMICTFNFWRRVSCDFETWAGLVTEGRKEAEGGKGWAWAKGRAKEDGVQDSDE